jgi:hypothetical protein
MIPDDFRRIALTMEGALEGAHMGHPDFRVGNKIFATLGYPDENSGMVKLAPEQQRMLVTTEPEVFRPIKGTWGKRGSTQVRLNMANDLIAANAIRMAWANVTSE